MTQSAVIEAPINPTPPRRGRPPNPRPPEGTNPGPGPGVKPRAPRGSKDGLNLQQVCFETRRQAAAILEVLAGLRTPTQAAKELGIAMPVYYKLEQRALASVVEACQPRPRGPGRTPGQTSERDLAAARRECETLRRELNRQQALTRAAQRAMGLSAVPPPPPPSQKAPGTPGKRHRKPVARAIRTIAALRKTQPSDPPPTAAPSPPPTSDGA